MHLNASGRRHTREGLALTSLKRLPMCRQVIDFAA